MKKVKMHLMQFLMKMKGSEDERKEEGKKCKKICQ
jgi:hypothetical protein